MSHVTIATHGGREYNDEGRWRAVVNGNHIVEKAHPLAAL